MKGDAATGTATYLPAVIATLLFVTSHAPIAAVTVYAAGTVLLVKQNPHALVGAAVPEPTVSILGLVKVGWVVPTLVVPVVGRRLLDPLTKLFDAPDMFIVTVYPPTSLVVTDNASVLVDILPAPVGVMFPSVVVPELPSVMAIIGLMATVTAFAVEDVYEDAAETEAILNKTKEKVNIRHKSKFDNFLIFNNFKPNPNLILINLV